MATKVKPCRIKATGTPQAWYVPKYVDEDTFQWGTWGWWSDIVYATQAEYNALLPWALTDGKHYFIYSTSGGGGWQPWANTIAYYDFNNQSLVDSSWNNNDASWYNWTWSYVAVAWGYCASLWWSHAIQLPFTVAWTTEWTLNTWINIQGNKTYNWIFGTLGWTTGTMHINYSNSSDLEIAINPNTALSGACTLTVWTWYNVVITKNWTTYSIYLNSTSLTSWTRNNFTDTNTLYLWTSYDTSRILNWYLDNVIIEDKARTAQEVADYYDLTKWDYWIS